MADRIYFSGHHKRMLKKQRDEKRKKVAGAIEKYIVAASDSSSKNISVSDLPKLESACLNKSDDQNDNIFASQTLLEDEEVKNCQELSNPKNLQPYDDDPALWLEHMIDFFISKPPIQNMHLISETVKQIGKVKRSLTVSHFYCIKQNSEKVLRKWLVLSRSTKKLFCWVCRLLNKNSSSIQLITGFNDWKHASIRLCEHENSVQHRQAICQMSQRTNVSQRIDSSLIHHYEEESNYWKSFFGDDEGTTAIS